MKLEDITEWSPHWLTPSGNLKTENGMGLTILPVMMRAEKMIKESAGINR